ncbi:hypothetical protein CSC2_48280 [Clostridium zeae]|uniref:DUF1430 domain-containing protein n=1 Tax=Clostridium zeae TaxID=2759022 RepID=A0ABQ1EHU9_9CLOT|nr:DUF1430 domain-containing protein [Clostridium zeae]GFZ34302.1 hypothetical protein CSC2_48280 [Clostridium zeae]
MKKIITILLIVISTFSFFILFNNKKQTEDSNMEKVEQNINNSYKILIPDEIGNRKQNDVYNVIIEVLKKHNANIYYSRIGANNKVMKFIYLTNLNYLDNFIIENGRSLHADEMESQKFLSSKKTNDNNQVGKIATFDGKENFEIYTLKSLVDSNNYLLSGDCLVQLNSSDNIDSFLQDLSKELKVDKIDKLNKDISMDGYYYNKAIIPSLYFIIAILLLYNIIKSYKNFGIQKMLGYSGVSIWLNEVLHLLIIQCFILLVVDIGLSIYLFQSYNLYYIDFLKTLIFDNLKQILMFFIFSSIPFLYINNIKVIDMIKNMLPIKQILIFNFIVKVILVLLMLNLVNQGIQNYTRIKNVFSDNYKRWDDTQGYYVIPSLSTLNADIDMPKIRQQEVSLYHTINKEGAIMADFYNFSPSKHNLLLENGSPLYAANRAVVNPNYLMVNPVYDELGNSINIKEDETSCVLLIPESFKDYEHDIRDYYQKQLSSSNIKDQKIKIIYTKSSQRLFSYELDINPDNGNMVEDPILKVITEKNDAKSERTNIIGKMGNPIKIKVLKGSNPQEYIKLKLKEVGLEKYVDKISPVNDGIAFESANVYKLLSFIVGGLLVLIISITLIITQNIYCFFEQYKKHLAVRQFHGYKTIDKYKEYFILLSASWILTFAINMYTTVMSLQVRIISISIFILIELIITILVMKFVSKRKITNVIKGS